MKGVERRESQNLHHRHARFAAARATSRSVCTYAVVLVGTQLFIEHPLAGELLEKPKKHTLMSEVVSEYMMDTSFVALHL